jgi:hypothetical protein
MSTRISVICRVRGHVADMSRTNETKMMRRWQNRLLNGFVVGLGRIFGSEIFSGKRIHSF